MLFRYFRNPLYNRRSCRLQLFSSAFTSETDFHKSADHCLNEIEQYTEKIEDKIEDVDISHSVSLYLKNLDVLLLILLLV